jgi:heparanase 1
MKHIQLLPLLVTHILAATTCSLVNDTVLGTKAVTFNHSSQTSVEDCCDHCHATLNCRVFTFEPSSNGCFLKSANDLSTFRAGAISGTTGTFPPTPPPTPERTNVDITINPHVTNTIDPGFKCWNIDASPNRQWETRDLSDPFLSYLGKGSLPGYLRFGGAGNDGLNYPLNITAGDGTCGPPPKSYKGHFRCMNRTWFDNLMNFASDSTAKIVFGINIDPKTKSGGWDPAQARSVMEYAIKKGYTFYGFELGNEQNGNYSPNLAAGAFQTLAKLLAELWPSAETRPKIIGPDIHGFHQDPATDKKSAGLLQYLGEFGETAAKLGVPMHALTHHEYIEVPEYPAAPANASIFDLTGLIAKAVNHTLSTKAPGVQIWAGEIGPHNGGSPGCDHSNMRWANFGDAFWYLDAMGQKAANGYSVFCRQDFVGIDYGMIDCATYNPLPDYYAGMLWSRLMGREVLSVDTAALAKQSEHIRVYAHCAPATSNPTDRMVTVLVLNTSPTLTINATLHLGSTGAHKRVEWVLTGPDGTASTEMALGGILLALRNSTGGSIEGASHPLLPTLEGNTVAIAEAVDMVEMAPKSIAFVQVQGSSVGATCVTQRPL